MHRNRNRDVTDGDRKLAFEYWDYQDIQKKGVVLRDANILQNSHESLIFGWLTNIDLAVVTKHLSLLLHI